MKKLVMFIFSSLLNNIPRSSKLFRLSQMREPTILLYFCCVILCSAGSNLWVLDILSTTGHPDRYGVRLDFVDSLFNPVCSIKDAENASRDIWTFVLIFGGPPLIFDP